MSTEDFKQVIAVRSDLKLSKGKLAVQVAHASVSAVELARDRYREWLSIWLSQGQKKVAVKVKNLSELLEIKSQAESLKLPTVLIVDSGLTELPPGTATCVGIGPAPAALIDKVTGKLKLL